MVKKAQKPKAVKKNEAAFQPTRMALAVAAAASSLLVLVAVVAFYS